MNKTDSAINGLAKQFDQIAKQFDQIDRSIADVQRRLDVIEKSRSALAHRPRQRALTSWSATGLAAALAEMSPAELEKLRQ
jgi:hypothetical protein